MQVYVRSEYIYSRLYVEEWQRKNNKNIFEVDILICKKAIISSYQPLWLPPVLHIRDNYLLF